VTALDVVGAATFQRSGAASVDGQGDDRLQQHRADWNESRLVCLRLTPSHRDRYNKLFQGIVDWFVGGDGKSGFDEELEHAPSVITELMTTATINIQPNDLRLIIRPTS
jgi:hypothetical protein